MAMPPVRALSRGLAVLEALARSPHPLTPGDVAETTGLDRATSSRLLLTLVEDGFVRKAGSGHYSLTSRLLELASAGGTGAGLREAARPVMRELRDQYDETVHLGVVEDRRVVYIEKLEPSHQRVALITAVGQSMAIHSTALGKAMLSRMPQERVNTVLDGVTFDAKTPATITSRTRYIEELAATRERGYAVDHGENLPDASCVAAPILNAHGDVLAGLSMSSPTSRIADRFAELGPVIEAAARKISAALGSNPR